MTKHNHYQLGPIKVIHIDKDAHALLSFLKIRSGSRWEDDRTRGAAHLLEHLVFKGTKKYQSTLALAQAIEGVGGYFNAWTSLDHTAYWNLVPVRQAPIGLAMPFELAFRPLLRDVDLERERGVIIEEIRMYNDQPADYVELMSQELIFQGHNLAHPIIGYEDTVKSMTIAELIDYRNRFYNASHSLFVVVGRVDRSSIEEAVMSFSRDISLAPSRQLNDFTVRSKRAFRHSRRKIDQTHLILSTASRDLSLNSPKRFSLAVLNAILGVGMSSRLFLEVRERLGLAYTVRSSIDLLEETGSFSIYAGVNSDSINKTLATIANEIVKLKTKSVDATELNRAKTFLIGALELKSDDPIALARWYATEELLGDSITFEQAKRLIGKVTSADVADTTNELFQNQFITLATIGPQSASQIDADRAFAF